MRPQLSTKKCEIKHFEYKSINLYSVAFEHGFESEGTSDQTITQIRQSQTLQRQSISAATQLSLNVKQWSHSELAAWS